MIAWSAFTLDAIFPWARFLPADDREELLAWINAYCESGRHTTAPEWVQAIGEWRVTAELWRDDPAGMSRLVTVIQAADAVGALDGDETEGEEPDPDADWGDPDIEYQDLMGW